MGILGAEISIIVIQFLVYEQSFNIEILYLIVITAIAMALFLGEGIVLHRKTRPENHMKE